MSKIKTINAKIQSKPKVTYLCDELKCPDCNQGLCFRTTDIKHAVNFEKISEDIYNEIDDDDRTDKVIALKNRYDNLYKEYILLLKKYNDLKLEAQEDHDISKLIAKEE